MCSLLPTNLPAKLLICVSRIDIRRSCATAPQRLGHEHRMVRFVYSFPTLPVLFFDVLSFYIPTSRLLCLSPRPRDLLEVYINKEDLWINIRERGKGRAQEYPHLIPICMLAPTLPRTLVRGVGWNTRSYRDPIGAPQLEAETTRARAEWERVKPWLMGGVPRNE